MLVSFVAIITAPCLMEVPRLGPCAFQDHSRSLFKSMCSKYQVYFRILVLTVSEIPMKSRVQSKSHVCFSKITSYQGFPLPSIHPLESGFVN